MIPKFSKVKGIHPGLILKREIKIRGLKGKELADSINEHPQTISAIINERRAINPNLSIKLGESLGIDKDYFMLLQASYEVGKLQAQNINQTTPNLDLIRKSLFWDTQFNKIDWIKNKRAVIKRIFERGNEEEILEIIQFYGKEEVSKILKYVRNDFLPSFQHNVDTYI